MSDYKMQSQRIAEMKSENAIKLIVALRDAILDATVVPNNCLPVKFHNNKTKDDNGSHGPSLAQIQRKLNKIANNPAERKAKNKKDRIAFYGSQHDKNMVFGTETEFTYCEPDEFWQEPKLTQLAHDIATA